MQTINITEEMKADAAKLINAVDVFRSKYGLRMVSVDAFTYEKSLKVYGDRDENDEFDTWYIRADETTELSHVNPHEDEED